MNVAEFFTGDAFTSIDQFEKVRQTDHTLTVDEGQRQLIIMALATLSMERPGWVNALEEIALLMDNKREDGRAQMFEGFREIWTRTLREKLTAES